MIRKTLPESGTELKVDTSPLLEPVAYSLQDVASQTMVSQLAYNLDAHGRVGASAAKVPRMQWQALPVLPA